MGELLRKALVGVYDVVEVSEIDPTRGCRHANSFPPHTFHAAGGVVTPRLRDAHSCTRVERGNNAPIRTGSTTRARFFKTNRAKRRASRSDLPQRRTHCETCVYSHTVLQFHPWGALRTRPLTSFLFHLHISNATLHYSPETAGGLCKYFYLLVFLLFNADRASNLNGQLINTLLPYSLFPIIASSCTHVVDLFVGINPSDLQLLLILFGLQLDL